MLFSASLFKKGVDFSKYNNLSVQVFTSTHEGVFDELKRVQNGNGDVYFLNIDEYDHVKNILKTISGVTFIFDGTREDFLEVQKKLKLTYVKSGETDFVGYSNTFDSSIDYDGKKVNVQGYFSSGRIFIGTPLILGSY